MLFILIKNDKASTGVSLSSFFFLFHRLAARGMHVVHDSVSLPVLRPNGGVNVADRKRRQQALVRGRGKKDFY